MIKFYIKTGVLIILITERFKSYLTFRTSYQVHILVFFGISLYCDFVYFNLYLTCSNLRTSVSVYYNYASILYIAIYSHA